MFLCELAFADETIELARVRDLSEAGIKIATARPLQLGDRLRVRLPGGVDWVTARIAWHAQGVAGLSFARPVRLPEISGASLTLHGATRWNAG